MSNEDIIKMATIPFEENNKTVLLVGRILQMYSAGAVNLMKPTLKKNASAKRA